MASKMSVSERIVKSRVAAGGDADRCPTCCRAADAPFRRMSPAGDVVHGCIDAVHERHMAPAKHAATGAWHFRPEAVEMRRQELERVKESQAYRRSLEAR